MAKFVPRVRKQKAKQRLRAGQQQDTLADSNATEIVPSKHDIKRDQLRDELRANQPHEKISSKKRKRLNHYIDTKLRKEENLELIKKLAAHKTDTSLLRSAKNLGRGSDTQREQLQRALREHEKGINTTKNEQILFEQRPAVEIEEDDVVEDAALATATAEKETQSSGLFAASEPAPLFGSGLKRPLELGEDGRPIMKKRKRRKVAKPEPEPELEFDMDSDPDEEVPTEDEEDKQEDDGDDGEGSEWGGFSDGEVDTIQSTTANGRAEPAVAEQLESREKDGSDEAGSQDDDPDSDDVDEDEDDEDEDDDEDSEDENEPSREDKTARTSAFKAWATQQRNAALGFTPTASTVGEHQQPGFKPQIQQPRIPDLGQPIEEGADPSIARPAVSVLIPRTEDIQEARLKLPVVQEEQKIMEAIHNQKVTVIWGATGSGKTTQVPQMMFESGYGSKIGDPKATAKDRSKGLIGVTQPRRVAATSVADRVATEMGGMKNKVGYQVRFDSLVSSSTAIKFMTDGILLREIANDFTLSRYSAIVIDEAHERSVNTDILIGLMSRIVDLRDQLSKEKPEEYYPIKLVIMSATLRVEDFTRNPHLFRQGPPPIVQAEGRQFPVVEHFSRRTERDYVEEMYRKVSRGHKKLPPGGMLVFLTGQDEIITLAKRLRKAFASSDESSAKHAAIQPSAKDVPMEAEDMDGPSTDGRHDFDNDSEDEIDGLDDEEENEFDVEGEEAAGLLKVHVLPLYSQLPAKEQMKVFQPAPDGSRSIILATNVAETSLTIPGVRYVFDCGRSKEKRYETSTGVQTFEIGWISKASASQRAGRAGRTGPGHCYRLYSSAVYERDFQEYAVPEILRTPVENVALMVKNVDFPNVANFPFPTPPDRYALAKAEDLLRYLGAIDTAGKITDTGRTLAAYPLSPRYGRMMLLAASQNLLAHTIALVACLAVPELLLPENQFRLKEQSNGQADNSDSDVEYEIDEEDNMAASAAEQKRKSYNKAQGMLSRWDDRSDAMKLLMAFALCSAPGKLSARCDEYFIREKGMKEALELRQQLIRIARLQTPTSTNLNTLPVLTPEQRGKLKFILAAGFIDQVAIRLDLLREDPIVAGRKPRRAIEVAYRSLFPSSEPDMSATAEEKEMMKNVYVHPGSVLSRLAVAEMPPFIVYSHLSRATPKTIDGSRMPKTRLHPLCTVGAKQLVALADGTPLLEVGKPIGKIEVLGRSEEGHERRSVWVGLSLKGKGDVRWPVGSRKEIQVRKASEWVTEKVVG
ncbi:hypothetical protein MBLNU457_7232t1 [Dothideomycetes sp. NU457]